jgi:hypothetical protein
LSDAALLGSSLYCCRFWSSSEFAIVEAKFAEAHAKLAAVRGPTTIPQALKRHVTSEMNISLRWAVSLIIEPLHAALTEERLLNRRWGSPGSFKVGFLAD